MGDCSLSIEKIRRWMRRFSTGCRSFEDEDHLGHPPNVMNQDTVTSRRSLVEAEPRTPIFYLSSELDLSVDTAYSLLHVFLCKGKICARWVPHRFSDKEKATRVEIRVTQKFVEEYKIKAPFPLTLFP